MDVWKLRYSGKLTGGVIPRVKMAPPVKDSPLTTDQLFNLTLVRIHGVMETIAAIRANDQPGQSPPIGLSHVSNSHSARPVIVRGQKGITSQGRDTVMDACSWLEDTYGKGRLGFLTCTLPPGVAEKMTGKKWTILVKNFKQKLSRHLASAGGRDEVVGVTEVQTSRFKTSGVVALHLHVVFVAKGENGRYLFNVQRYQECWNECVKYVIGNAENADWRASCNIQEVKKSAGNYLAKYMSKGKNLTDEIIQSGGAGRLPASWYFCTKPLRSIVMNAIKVMNHPSTTEALTLLNLYQPSLFRYFREVEIPKPSGGAFTCGISAMLSDRANVGKVGEYLSEYAALYDHSDSRKSSPDGRFIKAHSKVFGGVSLVSAVSSGGAVVTSR